MILDFIGKKRMTNDVSEQILNAAENRFRTYGFGKTTMAEIAGDIGMSTANLYRYYENKLAIGSAMAERCFCERKGVLTEIVNRLKEQKSIHFEDKLNKLQNKFKK